MAIEADDGARGEYVALWGGSKMALGQTLALCPHLIGRDPHQRELIYDDFKRALRQYDHMGVGCLDIALWDLAGKQLGAPIWKMLGGWRKRLPTYASSYHGDRNGGLSSAQDYVDFAEQCYEMGYRAFKMHGWCDGNVKEESEAVLALGRQFRGRMTLMLDPACELRTFADALAVGRACDEAGFFWYEDPMRDGGWSQHFHKKLRHFIKTPLLQTEHVRGPRAEGGFHRRRGDRFRARRSRVRPRHHRHHEDCAPGRGIRAGRRDSRARVPPIAIAWRRFATRIFTNWRWSGRSAATRCRRSTPTGIADELDAVGTDGCFPVPDGPGLGVSYDWEFIRRQRTAFHEFK